MFVVQLDCPVKNCDIAIGPVCGMVSRIDPSSQKPSFTFRPAGPGTVTIGPIRLCFGMISSSLYGSPSTISRNMVSSPYVTACWRASFFGDVEGASGRP